jgi:hypothetical protein
MTSALLAGKYAAPETSAIVAKAAVNAGSRFIMVRAPLSLIPKLVGILA